MSMNHWGIVIGLAGLALVLLAYSLPEGPAFWATGIAGFLAALVGGQMRRRARKDRNAGQ